MARSISAGGLTWSRSLAIAVLALGTVAVPAFAKDIALISNKSDTLPAMTLAEVVKVFKAQTKSWPSGKLVTVVIRQPGSVDMKLVEEKIYGATPEELRELITTVNHSRSDRPAIVVVSSDEDVIRKVESVPGAVGLVDVYSITGAVTVQKIGGKLPLEPGYPLHGN